MPELESVRGLAAMSVALFHSAHVIPIEGNREVYRITLWHLDSLTVGAMRLIMVVFSGGPPVSLFFVLSGFVLMLALIRDERAPLSLSTAFAGRRFFRIYPAAAIEISLMALLIGATQRDFWLNFLFIQPTVNGATWSLIIEAVAIPFVLIAFWCCRRFGVGGLYALTAVSLVMFVFFARQYLLPILFHVHVRDGDCKNPTDVL